MAILQAGSTISDARREYERDYWKENHERKNIISRRYRDKRGRAIERQQRLGGNMLPEGQTKRQYTGKCEMCGRTYEDDRNKFHYHHWNDDVIRYGLWLCARCHWVAEGVDSGLVPIYLKLKLGVEKEEV